MPGEPDETVEPVASGDTIFDTDTKSALAEVVALIGTLGQAAHADEEVARQVADIVGIDQPRSLRTLPPVLRMAASGVLMLVTLEATDAISALRLLRNGINAELLTENLSGILGQTLVRKICPNCKEYYEVSASDLRRFGYHAQDLSEQVQLARGAGCEQCRNTGYKGRIGLFELLTLNDEMADMIMRGAKRTDLKEAAKANGMMELRADGLAKILQGITTPDEVLRAVFASST